MFLLYLLAFNLLPINCQENSISPTKRYRDQLIDDLFLPHQRDQIHQKIENNLIWENRLEQVLEKGKKTKFKSELAICDQAIGLRQFICPIFKPLIGNAVSRNRHDALEAMIDYDFDPNILLHGVTPLNIALKKLDIKSFTILLSSPKIDVNKMDLFGFSALNIAIIFKNENIVSFLLDHGATVINSETSIFNIDLDACSKMSPEIKKLISDYAKRTKIARTAYERWLEKQLVINLK